MSYRIVDKRNAGSNKNISNRQRFIEKAKKHLRKSVREGNLDRSITSEEGHTASIPIDGIDEPTFRNNPQSGNRDLILPGNKDFMPGDLIEKPKQGAGASGKEGSPDGEGTDSFDFVLTEDEYYNILFEDLELPYLTKKAAKDMTSFDFNRSGYTNEGCPANLDLEQSLKNSLGRRIALKKPKEKQIVALEEELGKLKAKANPPKKNIKFIEEKIESLKSRASSITYIDPIDLRYRNFEKTPKPKHKAVIFAVMDVSASMGNQEKDLAKRFYILLYRFLNKKYDNVEIVFIRHHTRATECTEEEFFYSKETGGTIVSTGFELANSIQKERFPDSEYNIYFAQCSDGDNFGSDNNNLIEILTNKILPISQYFTYLEVRGTKSLGFYGDDNSDIWGIYNNLSAVYDNMQAKQATTTKDVYVSFREFFEKQIKE